MLHTSARQVTRQFTTRVPPLAAELGLRKEDKRMCRRMYDARSQGAHGSDIDLLQPEARHDDTVRQLARLQAVLRGALRRGIENPVFRAAFESDETVRERWPVTVSLGLMVATHPALPADGPRPRCTQGVLPDAER
jgi:hypothetical protein